MKKYLVIFSIFFLATSLYAKELNLQKSFRGITFFPKMEQKVKELSIKIPSICKRSDSLHAKHNYPVTAFMANCSNTDSCFSLLIIISIIPDKIQNYDELIKESKNQDYSGEPFKNEPWMAHDKSNSDKMIIFFGSSKLSGNVVNGFYYDKINKETYKITTRLIYSSNFPEDDWRAILFNTFAIYNSITLTK